MGLVGLEARFEARDQSLFVWSRRPAGRNCAVEARPAELGHPAHEVAENVGQILVHACLEVVPGELAVRVFGCMAQEPPAPVVGGKDVKRMIHEDPATEGGRELPAIVVQVVERLDVVHELPGLARSNDRRRKAERVEGHVVLAHELDIADIVRALVSAPPSFPLSVLGPAPVRPLLGARNVLDRRIEPDIEDLAFHAGPGFVATHYRDAPVEIAGDAPILQTVAVIQPLPGDRGG